MPYSLEEILLFKSIDLDNFEIRGAKVGINNARTTGVLYTEGSYVPSKTLYYGAVTITDGTAHDVSFGGYDATSLKAGDTIDTGLESLTVTGFLNDSTITVSPIPQNPGIFTDATFSLAGREYLVEPDEIRNTFRNTAVFTNDSSVMTGLGFSKLATGDAIQSDTYQEYYLAVQPSDTTLVSHWPGDGNANDIVSGYNAVWHGTPAYNDGFLLDGVGYPSNNPWVVIPYHDALNLYGTDKFKVEFNFKVPQAEMGYLFARFAEGPGGEWGVGSWSLYAMADSAYSYLKGDIQFNIEGHIFTFKTVWSAPPSWPDPDAWQSGAGYDLCLEYNSGVCTLTIDGDVKAAQEGPINVQIPSWTGGYFFGFVYGRSIIKDLKIINNSRVVDDTRLVLNRAFKGPTVTGNYTAKRWRLGREMYQYAKNNFTYDNQSAKWKYDATTGSDFTGQTAFSDFVDGIMLKFSPTMDSSKAPDMMDSNVALNKTLSRSTVNDLYQFPMPVVPNPEESFELYTNNSKKTNETDYAITYSQSPVYQSPPPVDERTVANLMFLAGIGDTTLSSGETSSGLLVFKDSQGNNITGLMPGSETIWKDGAELGRYSDYVLDADSGQGYISQVATDEAIVKYVAYQKTDLYGYGFGIDRTSSDSSSVPQKITIPPNPTDDVLFDYESGRFKPARQDVPGLGEEYIVDYYVGGDFVSNENVPAVPGSTSYVVKYGPIRTESITIIKNDDFLDEGTDFRVGYLSGRIVFFTPLAATDVVLVNYTTLKNHVNGLTYEYGNWYCKAYREVSAVSSATNLSFKIPNAFLADDSSVAVQRIYNETKAKDYNVAGYTRQGQVVSLIKDSTNTSFVTSATDTVLMDYKFSNDGVVEYTPVETIKFTVLEGTNYAVFGNLDCTGLFTTGKIVRLTNVDTAGDFFFVDASSVYDGYDTLVYFTGTAPQDIVNPYIYITDSSVGFIAGPPILVIPEDDAAGIPLDDSTFTWRNL